MIRAAKTLGLLALSALFSQPAFADGVSVRTSFASSGAWSDGSSLDAALGFQKRTTSSGGARFMWNKSAGAFRFEIHSHLAFAKGSDVAYATLLAPFVPTPAPATYFNLTQTWLSSSDTVVQNTVDRLNMSFSTPNFVVKVGRQAITWGSGTVFHPGDIVAPFSPNAIDTSYKTGADMVYLQYLFDNGADIQAIAVPRAAVLNGPVTYDSSTFALKGHVEAGSLDTSLMLARDRADTVASVGLSGALGGASWNAEYVHWALAGGAVHPSWLINISNFGTLLDRNISYFAEYYHNGFGVDASTPLDSLPVSLTKRMSTGQVFYAGLDYLALGALVQLSPDLTIAPNAIVSLGDRSTLAGVSVNYVLGDNTNLVFAYFRPFGAQGTDFGGRETSLGSGIYGGAPNSASLQLVHFF